MTKKIIYIFILLVYLLLTFSCADSFRSQVRIFNDTDYTITDIDFADVDFPALNKGIKSDYKWIYPSSYRLKCVINASTPANEKQSVQINMLKKYTLVIRFNNSDNKGRLIIKEDGNIEIFDKNDD